jgi:alpha-L-rhamnosidase
MVLGLTTAAEGAVAVDYLRCEYLENPLGISEIHPRLSWVTKSLDRGEVQTAYQIRVASTPELLAAGSADLWDTGKVSSAATSQIVYSGATLTSRSRCIWQVRSWNKDDIPSDWSPVASWTEGLLNTTDWSAKWIDGAKIGTTGPVYTPVITNATYHATDGTGTTVSVTTLLTTKAQAGSFSIVVNNANLDGGADPAYNHVKQLDVFYTINGVTGKKTISENGTFNFPDDIPQPVAATVNKVYWEAVDGFASLDVTTKFNSLLSGGAGTVTVSNANFTDPAPNHLKRMRILYTMAGQSWIKYVAEDASITIPGDLGQPSSIPYLRKSFTLSKPIQSATVYTTALGIYEMSLNGSPIGDESLAPGWTDYRKRLQYQTYDVTSLVQTGANVIGAQVANGWYSGHIGNGGYQYYGTSPALYSQLEVTYTDGTTERVVTDSSWKIHVSPMIATDFMLGEDYDARNEIPGWNQSTLDDSAWSPVLVRTAETARIMNGRNMPPVKKSMEISSKGMSIPAAGKYTYDLGQNMVGVIRLKIDAPAGTKITIRHGEMLDPGNNNVLYTANLRGAPSIDTYVCKGGGTEIYQPTFTFHGFRYVEISGMPTPPAADAVTGLVYGTDNPRTGSLTTSNPVVNQLESNIEWGQRGNYLSIPTDCPQRDERLGWMGDAEVFVRTATYLADVGAFFNKWMLDVTDSQIASGATGGIFTDTAPFAGPSTGTPAWGDAGVICPWTIYQAYGDLRLLQNNYPAMKKWVEYMHTNSSGNLRSGYSGSYGDWLNNAAETDKDLIATAYYAYSTKLLAKSAAALGNTTDAATYNALFTAIQSAFYNKYFYTSGANIGKMLTNPTQCGYSMALRFDLLPSDAARTGAGNALQADVVAKSNHLSTGFVGVSYLLPALTDAGKIDTAYTLLLQDSYPSWMFSIKYGATTIWERWDGWTPTAGFQATIMNSFNHYSLGSCGEWMYASMAGIDFDQTVPGYKQLIIHPHPGGSLSSVSGKLNTVNGMVTSSWNSTANNFVLNTTIPVNATATVYVPTTDASTVMESGVPAATATGVTYLRTENGAAVYQVTSGRYQFSANSSVIPGTDSVTRNYDGTATIAVSDLLSNDGDGATFVSADTVSLDGATITLTNGILTYTPRPGHSGTDSFTYMIKNGNGGMEVRTVNVSATPDAPAQTVITSEMMPDGSMHVVFSGVPGLTYRIWSSDDLTGASGGDIWTLRTTVVADSNGLFEFMDSPPLPGMRFYRSTYP